MSSAKAWGVEAELLTPAEVAKLVPFINTDIVLGGFYTPSVSVVDSLRAGTHLPRAGHGARRADDGRRRRGARDRRRDGGSRARRRTDQGRIEAEYVVVACGVWSPRIAAMAGATIPLTPAVHQMIDVGPFPMLEATGDEIGFPIVRDMDTFCYERQTGGAWRSARTRTGRSSTTPTTSRRSRSRALSPTELPFTADDFDQQLEEALELMPDILATSAR